MEPNNPIRALHDKRLELKMQRRLHEMVPVQVEILRLLQAGGRVSDVANAWNYLSVIFHSIGSYEEAEMAARSALTTYQAEPDQGAEVIATYEFVLACILAAQGRISEAVSVAESSIENFAVFHTPPDDFLNARKSDLAAIRAGRVPPLGFKFM